MASEDLALDCEDNMLTPSQSGSPIPSSTRELGFEPSPLMSPHSEPTDVEPANQIQYQEVIGTTPEELTLFSGAGFGEYPQPGHYPPSVNSNASLPLGHRQPPPSTLDRRCYSDNGDKTNHGPCELTAAKPRMARSLSPVSAVHLWQRQLDGWNTERPARSVAQAKRRHKNKVRHSINRVEALFPKHPEGKPTEKNLDQEL